MADLSRDDRRGWNSEAVLRLLQAVALLIGGCWVLYQYVTFQRESNQLGLRQQQVAKDQAEVVLKTQEQLNRVSLRRQELDIQQADIALRTQAQTQAAALAAQRVGVEQARLTLDIQQSQREVREQELAHEVEIKKAEVELRRQEIVLNAQKQERERQETERAGLRGLVVTKSIEMEWLRSESGGLSRFRVTPSVVAENRGRNAVEISLFVFDVFMSTVNPAFSSRLVERQVIPLGYPPTRLGGQDPGGAYEWRRMSSVAGVYNGAASEMEEVRMKYASDVPLGEIVGLTGSWNPGETAQFSQPYIVLARPGTEIGFTVFLVLDRGGERGSLHTTWWSSILTLPSVSQGPVRR